MFCRFRNRECKHTGQLTIAGCKELGEIEGLYRYTICYNDAIQRKYWECKLKENMDNTVKKLVRDYVLAHLDKSDEKPEFEIFTVWKCKILQNWKYLASTTLPDGMYYELTFDGDKNRWYLDAYKKFDNQCLTVGKVE